MARRSNPASDLFYAWSTSSIIGFWFIMILIASSVFFLNVPIGLSFFLMVFFLPLVWKDPDEMDAINGAMVRDTIPWKIATFMNTMKGPARKDIFALDDMFGIGPPETDTTIGVEEHFFQPPGRISAYFSFGFAFVLSFLDWLIHPVLYPLWSLDAPEKVKIPAILCQVISLVFFFGALQSLNTARRFQLAITLPGVDRVPAVIWHKIPKDGSKRQSLIRFGVTGGISLAVCLGVCIVINMVVPIPWLIAIGLSIVFSISIGMYFMVRLLSEAYRASFQQLIDRREHFNMVWAYKNAGVPFLDSETPIPGEAGKPGGPPADFKGEVEPHVWAATFAYPTNFGFADYANEVPKIEQALNADNAKMIVINPIPLRDEEGQTIPGTISPVGFRLMWADRFVPVKEILTNRDLVPEMLEVAIRYNIADPIADIKQINRCIVHSHTFVTAPESKVNILKIALVPPNGVTEKQFTQHLMTIRDVLGVDWIRVKRSIDVFGKTIVELYIGDGSPLDEGMVLPRGIARSAHKKDLMNLHWGYMFTMNKVTSQEGAPEVIISRAVTDKSEETVFNLPAGIDKKQVRAAMGALKSSSGDEYMEFVDGMPKKKEFKRAEQRAIDRYMSQNNSVSQFTIVSAKTHPLEDVFLFSKYEKELITGREPGVLKSKWGVGIKANGQIATHSFEKGDDPHLVLAGSSGSGKSALIYSMLVQLCANNSPQDLEIEIIDPKVGFGNFQYIDNVVRMVDQWTPKEGYFFEACRDLLRDACIEMSRRNKIFRFATHTDGITPYEDEAIDKLSTARRVGIQQGPMDDGSPNPLVMPMKIIIIDECAMLFADAPDPETAAIQKEILYYSAKLARESRSAGIHCLFSTQYPTKASLPSIIKQQSGRIGLRTQDNIASRVIIDQDGLEELYLVGSGKVIEGQSYVDFRGFLLEEDAFDEHSMSNVLESLPKRTPSVDVDGQDAVDRYNAVQQLKGGQTITGASATASVDTGAKRAEVPAPVKSIFTMWDSAPDGTASSLRSATEPKKDKHGKSTKTGSKADRITTVLENLDLENMDEDTFDMTLKEFKKFAGVKA